MRPKLPFAPQTLFRVPARGGARLAAVASLVGGVVVAALAPRAIRSAAVRPAEPSASLALAAGDTQVVYGPSRFDTPTGTPTLHVERFAVAVVPGRRYTLRVDNGAPDGSHRVSGGSVTLNGSQILSTADLGSGASGWSRVVQPLSEDTIQVTVQGTAGAYVTASLLSTPDASFLVFGPERFIRPSGAPVTETRHFTTSATAAAPYRMCIVNGNANGTQRISSATIMVNGVSVVTTSELNQHVGGLMKVVTLQRDNTITISLNATPGSFIDLCFNATDVTPPVITINQPANKFITRAAQVGVAGSVQDETATTVRVNGQPASMSGTSFTATVPLAAEGNNVIHIVATDAAGHSTDSSRTVIHDTQPPVLTLTSPADGLITKDTTATVSGTVTDLTAVTVNVNGIPLPADSTGAFHGAVALSEGSNILTVTATDAAGNATSQVRTVTRDTHAPVLAVTAPANGLITNHTPVTVSGSVTDASAVTVAVNGTPFTVGADGHFTGSVALTEGANTLTTVATDAAGNATTDTRAVTLDTHPPALAVTAPTDGLITKQTPVTVSGTVTDATPVTVDVNGTPLPVDGAGVFTGQAPLAEGANPLTVTAHDAATNTATVVRVVTLDTHAPAIAVTQPADGDIINAASVTTTGNVTDATATTLTVNGNPAPLGSGGAFSVEVPLAPNANTITYAATDAAGNSATQSITVTRRTSNLPPDPALVASVVNRAEVTTIGSATSFLYAGATPIQTGVAAGAINPVRAAVLRGRVLDRTFAPLGGATVTILGHPELGQTLSREDGGYDLAVNGGGRLTLSFVKDGYFPVQRATDVSWQDYTTLNDVILLQPDPAVTVVDLTSQTPPVARASVVSDADGSRQATLIFKPGNTATLTRPDGSTQALTTLSVRATEYSVGDSGKLAMPAELPPASQYTYAVQLSADEQLAAGAGARVTFAQPVPFYVENFLHVPVGTAVPTGGYDAAKGTWVPEPNGKVIKVLGKDANGRALVDITGDGQADPPSALAALGIDDYELVQLGGTYPAGSDLWRALAPRLEPEDLNFPFIFVGTTPTEGKVKAGCSSREGDPLRCQLQAQTAFQSVGIVGSPFTLNYASDRTQGNAADRKLDITLTGPTLQAQLLRVELEVDVAGKRFTGSFPPTPNLTYAFSWDGKDIYGRLTQGTQPATVLIGYVFPVQYAAPANAVDAFGLPCAPTGTGSACSIISNAQTGARAERTLVQEIETSIGTLDAVALGLGGFTLDVQNVYDPVGQVLYKGDGTRRAAAALPPGIRTVIGGCVSSCIFTGGPALRAQIGQVGGMTFASDGTLYFSDIASARVRRVTPDGIITTVAGGGSSYGDGGPATSANLGIPRGLALGPDGSLYIGDGSGQSVVRRVLPNGIITTFAGTPGQFGFAGDGGPATAAKFQVVSGIALGSDGSLYIGDRTRIRRVGPDGIITTVGGNANGCDIRGLSACGDGGLATRATFGSVTDVKVASDGSLYVVTAFPEYRVRRVTPDGIVRAVAGSGAGSISGDIDSGDGGPATLAAIGTPQSLAFGPDGSFYISEGSSSADANIHRVRRVTPNGIITTFAGTGVFGFSGDGGPAAAAKLGTTLDAIGVGPDGNVYVGGSSRIRKVAGFLPGFGAGQTVIASEDGSTLFVFSSAGRILSTVDATSRDTIYKFAYNQQRQLVSVGDRYGRSTLIERDASGRMTGTIGPDGQRTSLSVDAEGNLTGVTDDVGRAIQLVYGAGGQVSAISDPHGWDQGFTYDAQGNLLTSSDPAGGLTTLDQLQTPTLTRVSLRSSLGSDASFQSESQPTGGKLISTTLPSGQVVSTTNGLDGQSITRTADSTTFTTIQRPDPRLGMQAPLLEEVTRTPSGLTRRIRFGRAITLTDPADPNSVATQTDSVVLNGRIKTTLFNTQTGALTITEASGRQVFVQMDGDQKVTSVRRPGLSQISKTYDAQGRLVRLAQGFRSTRYAFDSAGNLATSTDTLGRTQQWSYDAAGRLMQRVLPGGRAIGFTYDSADNVRGVTPPGRPTHTFTFTPANLLESYTPPAVGATPRTVRYSYNTDGRLATIARPEGDTVRIAYDTLGRQTSATFLGGSIDVHYNPTTGLVSQVSTPGQTLAYGYDGRLRTSVTLGGTVSGVLAATYDSDFRISVQSVNGQSQVAFSYDPDGELIGVGAETIARNSQNALITGTTVGSVTTTEVLDSLGELVDRRAQFNGSDIWRAQETRDGLGRVATVNETMAGVVRSRAYQYDPSGRLSRVTTDGVETAVYEYDLNGNVTRVTTAAGSIQGQYDDQDRLISLGDVSYTYNPSGGLRSKAQGADTTLLDHDALGNLRGVTLPGGSRVEYVVDGENRRVGKKINGVLVQGFLYAGVAPLAELDGTNSVVARFVYGTRTSVPDYIVKNSRTYRLITDEVGSVRLVVDVQSGQVVQQLDYDAFGRILGNTNPGFQPFGFQGGLYDPSTGFTRFGIRDYDAFSGRWITKDPLGFKGGDPNVYAFAENDPINRRDPTGGTTPAEVTVTASTSSYLAGVAWSYAWGGCAVSVSVDILFEETLTAGALAKGCAINAAASLISGGMLSGSRVTLKAMGTLGAAKIMALRCMFGGVTSAAGEVGSQLIEDGMDRKELDIDFTNVAIEAGSGCLSNASHLAARLRGMMKSHTWSRWMASVLTTLFDLSVERAQDVLGSDRQD